jgi:hypothetical protein
MIPTSTSLFTDAFLLSVALTLSVVGSSWHAAATRRSDR